MRPQRIQITQERQGKMDYRKIIINRMQELDITYEELAEKVGMTRQSLWTLVNGKQSNNPVSTTGSKSIRLDKLEIVLKALGLRLAVLDTKKQSAM